MLEISPHNNNILLITTRLPYLLMSTYGSVDQIYRDIHARLWMKSNLHLMENHEPCPHQLATPCTPGSRQHVDVLPQTYCYVVMVTTITFLSYL